MTQYLKSIRIAFELKVISFGAIAIAGYLWTGNLKTSLGILGTETIISLIFQAIWLNKKHRI